MLIMTVGSVLRTLVVPRGVGSALTITLWRIWRLALGTLVRPLRGYLVRDWLLAWLAPFVLVSTLLLWLAGLFVAYGLLTYAISGLAWAVSLREAGSSLFTLGFASSDRPQLTALDFAAAASGPLVIALMISYLPTLYSAYNRRETEVTLLHSRAGEPAWGPELLARQGLVNTVDQLRDLYVAWERLAADIGESHANYPILLAFRSPQPYRSWIVGLATVMDAAALHLALNPDEAPPEARLVLRASFIALRDIARVVGIPFDPDPRSDAPLILTFAEYAEAVEHVQQAGFPAQRSAEESWPHFRGWRINYESIVRELSRRVDAVPALWTGPRDWPWPAMPPARPSHRDPDRPAA